MLFIHSIVTYKLHTYGSHYNILCLVMQDKAILIKLYKGIKQIRLKNNYTQQYVSDKLNIDRAVYARYEKQINPTNIKFTTLYKILKFYNISLEDLLK